jgi:hypothetical protein
MPKLSEAGDSKRILMKLRNLIKKVSDLYPYRVAGDADTYSNFNQGWEAACDEIDSELQDMMDNKKFILRIWDQQAHLNVSGSIDSITMALDLMGITNYALVDITNAKFKEGETVILKDHIREAYPGEAFVVNEIGSDGNAIYYYINDEDGYEITVNEDQLYSTSEWEALDND